MRLRLRLGLHRPGDLWYLLYKAINKQRTGWVAGGRAKKEGRDVHGDKPRGGNLADMMKNG